MKKICIIDLDMTVIGGVEKVTTYLANNLSQWYHVSIISLRKEHKDWAYPLKKDINIITFAQEKGAIRIRKMLTLNWRPIRKYLRNQHVDLVFLMGTYSGFIGSLICLGIPTKVVFCDHGALMNQWKDRITRFLRYTAAKLSSYVVTLTEQSKNDYIKKFHIDRRKIQCIYNGINIQPTVQRPTYDAQSHKILTAGRFSKEKGYDMLVEVAKYVLPLYPQWEWHVYGTGDTFSDIQQKIKEYHLEEQLILKGQVSSMKEIFPQYAFLVLPSYREGLPLILLEAKAAGLPLVSYDVTTGPKEIIQHGEDGFLVPEKDIQAMAKAVETLMCNKDIRLSFSQNTQKNLIKFDLFQIIMQWKSLIEHLLEKQI